MQQTEELVGLPAIQEDGDEEDVSWMKEWAAREVANKKADMADEGRYEAEEQLDIAFYDKNRQGFGLVIGHLQLELGAK